MGHADVVPDAFGPDLPLIRDWTTAHYDFTGYITGLTPARSPTSRPSAPAWDTRRTSRICIVTVGGSGIGADLLRRVVAAFPEAHRNVRNLRMVVVTGPRIDPAALLSHDGLEVRSYVRDLYRHLAVSALAVVQGGLTTAMELTANGAGRRMDYATSTAGVIADAIATEIGRDVAYQPVETGGAARAAALIAELL